MFRVPEQLTAYNLVRLYRLPLRGRHARWSCPTNVERTLAVGRDDPGAPVQELLSSTDSFVCTSCRFAELRS